MCLLFDVSVESQGIETVVICHTGYERLQSLGELGWHELRCTGSDNYRTGRLQLS